MKPSLLGLLIAAVAFAGSTIYLSSQLSDERGHADKVAEDTRKLHARIAELEKARAEPGMVTFGGFGANATDPVRAPITSPAAAMEKIEPVPGASANVIVNAAQPSGKAFVRMMRSQARANNKRMYADVGAELGLSKDEANKLIDLLTDQETRGFAMAYDVGDGSQGQPGPRSRRDEKAEIADLIGPDKVQSLEEYQRTLPARQEVEMLARQFEGVDAALTDDQRKRLLDVIVEEQKRVPTPSNSADIPPEEWAKKYVNWQEEYNERVAAQARGILNSEQLATYEEYQEWQKEMRAHMATIRPTLVTPENGATLSFSSSASAVSADTVLLVPDDSADKPRKTK